MASKQDKPVKIEMPTAGAPLPKVGESGEETFNSWDREAPAPPEPIDPGDAWYQITLRPDPDKPSFTVPFSYGRKESLRYDLYSLLHDPTSFAVLVILPGILASLIVRYGLGIYMGLAKLRGDFLFLGAKVAAGVFALWWVGLILYGIVLYWKGGPTFRGKIVLTPDGFYKIGTGRKGKAQFARWHSTSRVEIRKADLYLYSKFGGAIFLPKEGIADEAKAEAVREATAQLWESNGSSLPDILTRPASFSTTA